MIEFFVNNLEISDLADGTNECDAENIRVLRSDLSKIDLSAQGQLVRFKAYIKTLDKIMFVPFSLHT